MTVNAPPKVPPVGVRINKGGEGRGTAATSSYLMTTPQSRRPTITTTQMPKLLHAFCCCLRPNPLNESNFFMFIFLVSF